MLAAESEGGESAWQNFGAGFKAAWGKGQVDESERGVGCRGGD